MTDTTTETATPSVAAPARTSTAINVEVIQKAAVPAQSYEFDRNDRAKPALDFYHKLLNKPIECKCDSGKVIDGVLKAYNGYELLIEIAGGNEIILSKHSILFSCLQSPEKVGDINVPQK